MTGPKFVPESLDQVKTMEQLIAYIQRQNAMLQRSIEQLLGQQSEPLHAPPDKVRDGLLVFADGVDWNPGAGAGPYMYYQGAWHYMVSEDMEPLPPPPPPLPEEEEPQVPPPPPPPAPPVLSTMAPANLTLAPGATAAVQLSINQASISDAVVLLSRSPTTFVSLPTSVTIPAGQLTAVFQITATGSGGPTTITASLNGSTRTSSVLVEEEAPPPPPPPPPALPIINGAYRWDAPQGGSNVNDYENWMGRNVDMATFFIPTNGGWAAQEGESWQLGSWRTWKNQRAGRTLLAHVGLIPNDGVSTLAQVAAGTHDSHWQALADNLMAFSMPDIYIRLGAEMDGTWFPWHAAPGETTLIANFKAAFARAVNVMRARQPSANWKFVLNFAGATGISNSYCDSIYPGDSVVDVIGLDLYDQSWIANTYPYPAVCDANCRATRQNLAWTAQHAPTLAIIQRLADLHSKPIGFPEWGVAIRPDDHGGGDNPIFIQRMYDYMKDPLHRTAFHSYWSVTASDLDARLIDEGGQATKFPLSANKFRELFGILPVLNSLLPSSATLNEGTSRTYTIGLNTTLKRTETVKLSVDQVSRLTVPASVTVAAGASTATFSAAAQLAGVAVITATLNGSTRTATATVQGSTPPPDPEPPTEDAPIIFHSFETSLTENGHWAIQQAASGRAALVDVGRHGGRCVALTTQPGDNNVAGSGSSERCDMSDRNSLLGLRVAGDEEWWAHSFMFPDSFDFPSGSSGWFYVWYQWHAAAGGTQPTFALVLNPSNRSIQLRVTGTGGEHHRIHPFGNEAFQRNVWYDFIEHFVWHHTAGQALTEVWCRKQGQASGAKVLTSTQPQMYSGDAGNYLKPSNYHTAFGRPSTVYHDRISMGRTRASVEWFPLDA